MTNDLKDVLDRAPVPLPTAPRKNSQKVQYWLQEYDRWYQSVNHGIYGLKVSDAWVQKNLEPKGD